MRALPIPFESLFIPSSFGIRRSGYNCIERLSQNVVLSSCNLLKSTRDGASRMSSQSLEHYCSDRLQDSGSPSARRQKLIDRDATINVCVHCHGHKLQNRRTSHPFDVGPFFHSCRIWYPTNRTHCSCQLFILIQTDCLDSWRFL